MSAGNEATGSSPASAPLAHDPLPDAASGNWVDRHAPPWLRPYLRLSRLDRPIGSWLLLLPCWWAACLVAVAGGTLPNPWHMALFALGAVVMRGAGCTFNDIIDRDLDAHVARTRMRPLASGQVGVFAALVWLGVQCFTGLGVLLQFNGFTVVLGALSLVVVAAYPFMKRVMGVPQLVLGLAFSWGALVGWSAVTGSLSLAPILLYGAAVAWTVGYDTIYALQDIEDDAVVGIRSSARTFGDHAVAAIAGCYGLAVLLATLAVWWAGGGALAFLGVAAFGLHLGWQALRCIGTDGPRALRLFRSNRDAGLLLAAGLFLAAFAGWLG